MAQTHSLDLESGSSQYAYNDSNTLAQSGSFSLMMWVKHESVAQMFYSHRRASSNTGNENWYFFLNNGNELYFGGTSIGGDSVYSWVPTVGVWYHIAAVFDTAVNLTKLYLDGLEVDTTAAAGNPTADTGLRTSFGADASGGQRFDGLIKDARVFSAALTQAQIIEYARTEHVVSGSLVAEYNLNNAYTDGSGNGLTLTAVNTPTFSTDIPWQGVTQVDGSTYLETNLVSWWTLNEASGTREDSHGINDLADNNTVGSASGKISLAADFESSNAEYLNITDGSQSGLDLSGNMTLACWINIENLPSSGSDQYFASKFNNGASQRAYAFGMSNVAGTMKFRYLTSSTGSNQAVLDVTHPLTTATWYHVVFSYVAATGILTVYANGQLIGTASGGHTSIFNSSAAFTLGAFSDPDNYFDGLIDETGIYSRSLHYGDVLDLYNAGSGITYSAAVAATGNAMFMGANF